MASISAGPHTFFRVSPAEGANSQSFALRRGDINDRLDHHFHKPHFHKLVKTLKAVGSKPMGSLIRYSKEVWDKSDGRFTEVFPYIEISGVGLGTNEYDVSEIPISEAPSRARQVVRTDDILVSLTRPYRGAIARVLPEHDGAIASTGFAVVRQVDSSKIDRDYLWLCLTAPFGCDQMLMRSSGGNYPAITKDELAQVLIPYVTLEEQRDIIAEMDAAQAERKKKLKKADALLAGLDDFVLDALGISLLSGDFHRVFAVKQGDLNELQLSPSRYMPELQIFLNRLQSLPTTTKPLGAYVDINPRVDVSGLDDQEMVGFIPMSAVSDGATGEYKFVGRPLEEVRKGYTPFLNGDILWAKITPCMQNGKSCIVENLPNGMGFGSTEFHVLRIKDREISKEFLLEFISQKTLRRVATYAFTGSAGQQRVPAEFLESLPFPKIPKSYQEEIVKKIKAARTQVANLRSEAESGWQDAKRWFEEQLLGSPSP